MSVTTSLMAAAAVDPSCHIGEVARLLWSMIALAAGAGLALIIRPHWLGSAALLAAALWWLWVDMEGPTLFVMGSHGLHLADIPVLIGGAAAAAGTGRLLLRRRRSA